MNILNRQQSIPPTPESVNELKRQSLRLEQVNSKLRERDRVLFDMVGKAIMHKDSTRAQIYANELSRVRHLKRVIAQSQLALDCIAIRLENFLDLYTVLQEMKPISQVVREVSVDIQKVLPQFAAGLDQLSQVASETLQQTSINFKQPTLDEVFGVKSQETSDILKEVSNMVESSLHESFPEPPVSMSNIATDQRLESISYGYEPTFKVSKAQENSAADWSTLSEDVVRMLDEFNSKEKYKAEEIMA